MHRKPFRTNAAKSYQRVLKTKTLDVHLKFEVEHTRKGVAFRYGKSSVYLLSSSMKSSGSENLAHAAIPRREDSR